MLRAIHAGGPSAHDFLEHLIDDMRVVMAEGVASGLVRPSRDEEARVRYLAYQTMGAMLVAFLTMPTTMPEEFLDTLRTSDADTVLPMLELLTEGLLTSTEMLDDYVRFAGQPAYGGTQPDPLPRPAATTVHPTLLDTKE